MGASELAEARYFAVILELSDTRPARLATLVPLLKAQLDKLSTEAPTEQIFRSVNADIFGYAIKSKLNAAQIRAAIESPKDWRRPGTSVEPFLFSGDHLLILEIGEDSLAGEGFTRFGTWLLRK